MNERPTLAVGLMSGTSLDGMDAALVYRGFGGEPGQDRSEYWWDAPDGSRCLMVHLPRNGYSAAYFHQDDGEQALARKVSDLRKKEKELEQEVARSGLGADLKPVPEPTVRDLSVPEAKPTRGRKGSYELVVTLRPGAGSGLPASATWQDTRTLSAASALARADVGRCRAASTRRSASGRSIPGAGPRSARGTPIGSAPWPWAPTAASTSRNCL